MVINISDLDGLNDKVMLVAIISDVFANNPLEFNWVRKYLTNKYDNIVVFNRKKLKLVNGSCIMFSSIRSKNLRGFHPNLLILFNVNTYHPEVQSLIYEGREGMIVKEWICE